MIQVHFLTMYLRPISFPGSVQAAIFSSLCIRAVYGLQNLLTERHLNNCAKLMLATGQIVAYQLQ
jgi:hypothetical protein